MAVKPQKLSTQIPAATNLRTFRTFLLMEQFAAAEIGERIAQARKVRGLTQEDLAAMASFSKRSLQDYESGKTIPYRHMRELGRLLGRAPEFFLYGEDPSGATQSVEADPAVLERLIRIERVLEVLAGEDGRDVPEGHRLDAAGKADQP